MLGILFPIESLGSYLTQLKSTVGYKMGAFVISFEGLYLFSFGELKREPKYVELSGSERKKLKMIRVIRSFADGPENFNPTDPAEDQTQKLISSTDD